MSFQGVKERLDALMGYGSALSGTASTQALGRTGGQTGPERNVTGANKLPG